MQKQRDRDATQALRSPWSDCVKRERAGESEGERESERESVRERGEDEGGGDRVREEGGNKKGESLSGPGRVHHHTYAISTFARLVTSSSSSPLLTPLLLPLSQRSLAPACRC